MSRGHCPRLRSPKAICGKKVGVEMKPKTVQKENRALRGSPGIALEPQSACGMSASRSIVVLYNDDKRIIKGEPRDLIAGQGVIACAHALANALRVAGCQVALVPLRGDVELALTSYPPSRWTVFNLGEGLEGRLFEEARIAWALEAMGYRFTGAKGDAIALSLNKARSKIALAANGVLTPPWQLFNHPDEVNGEYLQFPLIVKPVAEDASIGVGPESVAHSVDQLRERVAYVVEKYRQSALAETFVRGREFNISLWGNQPEVLPLAEVDFGAFDDPNDRMVSFAAKWDVGSFEYTHTPVKCPASVTPEEDNRIRTAALKAWEAIGCRGYGRVDMRMDEDGQVYMLEVNCNPDLSPDAGFYRAASAAGYDYTSMALNILRLSEE